MRLKPVPSPDYIDLSDEIGRTNSLRSRSGKKAKRKGSSFERRIAKELGEWWGVKFYRTPQSGGSPLKEGYELAGDVATPAKDFRFHVECKNQESLGKFYNFMISEEASVWKWWRQCSEECSDTRIPLLVFTKNHMPSWALMCVSFFDALHHNYVKYRLEKHKLGETVEESNSFEDRAYVAVNSCRVITFNRLLSLPRSVVIDAFIQEGKYCEED